jgi:hypothetical protein
MKIKYIKSKGQVFPVHVMKAYRGVEVQFHSFLTSKLDVGVVSFMIWLPRSGGKGSRFLLNSTLGGPQSQTESFIADKISRLCREEI